MEKHLHIISFTIPYPVNYGGVFDLFYKLKALYEEGIKIHLHCFLYNEIPQEALNKYCHSVHYYERHMGHKGLSFSIPYIISSRKNEQLFKNLLQDNYPIVMEGIHCCYLLTDERFKNRKKFVRLHNIEHKYYRYLAKNSSSFFKKIYFLMESKLLKKFERRFLKEANGVWTVSPGDAETLQKNNELNNIHFLPVFLPELWKEKMNTGTGCYCLYHGDLSIDANENAVIKLIKNVFEELKLPLVIAGKNPSKRLEKIAHKEKYTCLIANPCEKEMQDMIAKAHINIIPNTNQTGIPVKLLNALFNGKFCITTPESAKATGLHEIFSVATSAEDFKTLIQSFYQEQFTQTQCEKRHTALNKIYNPQQNAKQIVDWIWNEKDYANNV